MEVGHVLLQPASDEALRCFSAFVEALDRLAVKQHVLIADAAVARRLRACPFVEVGPAVRSPVVASCLMPDVDVVHTHETRSGQVGLLLTLTRSIPYVLTTGPAEASKCGPFYDTVLRRARAVLDGDAYDAERFIEIYRRVVDGSPLP